MWIVVRFLQFNTVAREPRLGGVGASLPPLYCNCPTYADFALSLSFSHFASLLLFWLEFSMCKII